MKDFGAFPDMRRYKNWVHIISSWKHLTIWRPVLLIFPEHGVPHSWFPPWTPFRECFRSAAAAVHDLTLVEVGDKCQFVVGRENKGRDNDRQEKPTSYRVESWWNWKKSNYWLHQSEKAKPKGERGSCGQQQASWFPKQNVRKMEEFHSFSFFWKQRYKEMMD